jgi:hypothetical protein
VCILPLSSLGNGVFMNNRKFGRTSGSL